MNIAISKPAPSEYPSYYETYIGKVPQNDLVLALRESEKILEEFIRSIPKEKQDYRYAAGKWSIKEIVSHLTDAERVFAYRAMRFSRNDKTPLPGFEENDYVPESNASNRSMEDILNEQSAVRNATIALFESFSPEMAVRSGTSNGKEMSVRSFGFTIVGHTLHHINVIKERYL